MQLIVSVSDAKASQTSGDCLVTYSLGSCIAVALYDPAVKVAGMLHFQLPTSSIDPIRARLCPMMFADTGLEYLIRSMEAVGCRRRNMRVALAGAAQMFDAETHFVIGRNNEAAIRRLIADNSMEITTAALGGQSPRAMTIQVDDGAVVIKTHDSPRETIRFVPVTAERKPTAKHEVDFGY